MEPVVIDSSVDLHVGAVIAARVGMPDVGSLWSVLVDGVADGSGFTLEPGDVSRQPLTLSAALDAMESVPVFAGQTTRRCSIAEFCLLALEAVDRRLSRGNTRLAADIVVRCVGAALSAGSFSENALAVPEDDCADLADMRRAAVSAAIATVLRDLTKRDQHVGLKAKLVEPLSRQLTLRVKTALVRSELEAKLVQLFSGVSPEVADTAGG